LGLLIEITVLEITCSDLALQFDVEFAHH